MFVSDEDKIVLITMWNPNMLPQKRARKQIYNSQKIQGPIVARLATYWVVYHLVLLHGMFLFHYFLYRGQLLADSQMTTVPFSELYSSFLSQNSSLLLCSVAFFPLILWDMLKLTHRVAGPLVRFMSTLKQLEGGEKVEPVRLREGDLLVELQTAFNSYLKAADLLVEEDQPATENREGLSGSPVESPMGDEAEDVLEEMHELHETAVGEDASAESVEYATAGSAVESAAIATSSDSSPSND